MIRISNHLLNLALVIFLSGFKNDGVDAVKLRYVDHESVEDIKEYSKALAAEPGEEKESFESTSDWNKTGNKLSLAVFRNSAELPKADSDKDEPPPRPNIPNNKFSNVRADNAVQASSNSSKENKVRAVQRQPVDVSTAAWASMSNLEDVKSQESDVDDKDRQATINARRREDIIAVQDRLSNKAQHRAESRVMPLSKVIDSEEPPKFKVFSQFEEDCEKDRNCDEKLVSIGPESLGQYTPVFIVNSATQPTVVNISIGEDIVIQETKNGSKPSNSFLSIFTRKNSQDREVNKAAQNTSEAKKNTTIGKTKTVAQHSTLPSEDDCIGCTDPSHCPYVKEMNETAVAQHHAVHKEEPECALPGPCLNPKDSEANCTISAPCLKSKDCEAPAHCPLYKIDMNGTAAAQHTVENKKDGDCSAPDQWPDRAATAHCKYLKQLNDTSVAQNNATAVHKDDTDCSAVSAAPCQKGKDCAAPAHCPYIKEMNNTQAVTQQLKQVVGVQPHVAKASPTSNSSAVSITLVTSPKQPTVEIIMSSKPETQGTLQKIMEAKLQSQGQQTTQKETDHDSKKKNNKSNLLDVATEFAKEFKIDIDAAYKADKEADSAASKAAVATTTPKTKNKSDAIVPN